MAHAHFRQLSSRFTLLALAAALTACQGPGAPLSSQAEVPQATGQANRAQGDFTQLDMSKATVTHVEIRPAADRQVQQIFGSRANWMTGDRARVGATNSIFGDDPLGFGFNDGGLLPFVRDGGVFLADLDNNSVFEVPSLGDNARNPRISDGGRFIVFEEDGELRVLDQRTQRIQTFSNVFGGGGRDIEDFDVDSFGNVAFVDEDGELHLFDPRTGDDFLVPAAGRNNDIRDISFSGNGRSVIFSDGDEIFRTDIDNGRVLSLPFINGFGGRGGDIDAFASSSDGDTVLFSDGGRIRLLDLDSGFIDNLSLLNSGGDVEDADFLSGDEDRILFERDGRIQVFDRDDNTINTLPILNRGDDDNSLGRFGGGFRGSRFNFGRFF